MKTPFKEWKIVHGLLRFAHNFMRFFKSRINVALTGGFAIVLGVLAACTLTTAIRAYNNPIDFAPTSCVQMRNKALEGDKFVVQSLTARDTEWHAFSGEDSGIRYYYAVSTVAAESNRFAFATNVIGKEYDYQLLFMAPSAVEAFQGNTISALVGNASFFDSATGKPYLVNGVSTELNIYMEPTAQGGYEVKSRPSKAPDGHEAARFEAFCQSVEKELEAFLANLPRGLRALGVDNPDDYLKDLTALAESRNVATSHAGLTVVLALLGTPMLGLFLSLWIRLLVADRRHRLIAQGKIDRVSTRTARSFLDAGPDVPREAPKENIESVKQHRRARGVEMMEDFVTSHHIRPVFGEWVFRGAGLALMLAGTLLASFVQFALAHKVGGGWDAFIQGEDYYDSITGLGSFILVIAVIVIISESRRNLAVSAAAFFTLALTYYTVSSSFYFFFDCFIDEKSASLSDYLASSTGGNVFLSLGIFAIIGFFLFYNPPRWFINRKLFRSLSIIPALLALGSIVFSYLIHAHGIILHYWQSGFFFVRNFDGLVIGMIMEFSIFGFRTHLGRAYGEESVDEQMERPIVQFGKNGILCGLVLFLTIVFYLIPLATRKSFNMGVHTFIYVTIPFFLFLKPSGKNHKGISDIIYYVLYAAVMGIPNLTAPFFSLFA